MGKGVGIFGQVYMDCRIGFGDFSIRLTDQNFLVDDRGRISGHDEAQTDEVGEKILEGKRDVSVEISDEVNFVVT